jgi:hypothetical protein
MGIMVESDGHDEFGGSDNLEIDRLTEELCGDFVADQIEKARQTAESCGCASCRGIYKFWLEWAGLEDETEKSMEEGGFQDDNGDGPPDINSGGLADWYTKDL